MKRLGLSLTLAAALAGCTPPREAQTEATPPNARTAMPQDPLAMRRFPDEVQGTYRNNSGITTATREAVRDAESWRGLWTRLTARVGPPLPPPQVDFAREMVLAATMGQRTTGGYSVRVESVRAEGGELVAAVVETSPGPRCGVTAALTAPADVVVVPRSPLPVRWVARQATADCP